MTADPRGGLVLRNAAVFSDGRALDGLHDVVVRGDRIVAVSQAGSAPPEETPTIDVRGRRLTAGLTDAHAHLDREGLAARLTSLGAPRSRVEVLDRITEAVTRSTPGEWIVTEPLGTPPDYHDAVLPGSDLLPSLRELDAVSPDNPVYIRPIWGYWNPGVPLVSMANSLALRVSGVHRNTPPPSQSVTIDRSFGALTGIFIEDTAQPIVEHTLLAQAPGFDLADRIAGIREGMRVYNRSGTTSIFEGHGLAAPAITAFGSAARSGPLTVGAALMLSPDWRAASPVDVGELVADWQKWAASRSGRLSVPGIYVEPSTDGDHVVRRSRHPETGWAGFSAASVQDPEALQTLLDEAARARIRVSTIMPGVARMMESTARRVGDIHDLRWVVSHQQLFTEADLDRIVELGIVLTTVTAHHLYRSGARAVQEAEVGERVLPLRTMLERGIPFALGTDNRPPSLFDSMSHVVGRRRRDGGTVEPDEALTPAQALSAMTQGGAFLMMEEADRGAVREGMRADLVVFDADPLTTPLDALAAITADVVVVAGAPIIGATEIADGAAPHGALFTRE